MNSGQSETVVLVLASILGKPHSISLHAHVLSKSFHCQTLLSKKEMTALHKWHGFYVDNPVGELHVSCQFRSYWPVLIVNRLI